MSEWKCCGCGIESPNRVRRCDCPTSCLYKRGLRESALKIDPPFGMAVLAHVWSMATRAAGDSA